MTTIPQPQQQDISLVDLHNGQESIRSQIDLLTRHVGENDDRNFYAVPLVVFSTGVGMLLGFLLGRLL